MDNNTQLLRDMENPRWWEEMFLFIRLIKRHLQKDEDYSMNLEEMDTRIEGLLK